MKAALDHLVTGGHARAAFLLDANGTVVHARGDFATQVIIAPSRGSLAEGWTYVRTGSGELIVFVVAENGALLCGVFDASADVAAARALLEAARTVQ